MESVGGEGGGFGRPWEGLIPRPRERLRLRNGARRLQRQAERAAILRRRPWEGWIRRPRDQLSAQRPWAKRSVAGARHGAAAARFGRWPCDGQRGAAVATQIWCRPRDGCQRVAPVNLARPAG